MRNKYIFLFDLDSTITKKEILPTIAEKIGKMEEMRELTESTMMGVIPFKTSFLKRVNLLKDLRVSYVSDIIENIPLNENIVNFIKENKNRCYVVTGNLNVWIEKLMKKLGLENHIYSSLADVQNDFITGVISVANKELIVKQIVQPFVVIGDGDNDSCMAKEADIAIGFGGVRDIAPSLLRNIDYAFYDDKTCADFLKSLL